MNLKKFFVLFLVLSGNLYFQIGHAELYGAPDNTPAAISKPFNGMSMETVVQDFGDPANRMAAVGEPPITRWAYNDFTVYFEHRLVIHSVTHR